MMIRPTQIVEYVSYKKYLQGLIKNSKRGFQTHLSRALEINPSQLNRIAYGDINLTEDQSARFCQLLRLDTLESEYFVALVQLEKANAIDAKEIFLSILKNLRDLKAIRDGIPLVEKNAYQISPDQSQALSNSTLYLDILALCCISSYKTASDFATRLKVSESDVDEALDYLINEKFLTSSPQGGYKLESMVYWDKMHPGSKRYKVLRREQAIESLNDPDAFNLDVSIPVTHAERLRIVESLRMVMRSFFESNLDSDSGDLLVINIDVFNPKASKSQL